ncbi:MAG TPA: DUF3037 domain-containing protein [Rhodanobacteraceae bacterium]|nr:DUF3037 domain-containing protein [Rhodanobacteraceae bacterium]
MPARATYDYAVIRVVPRVEREEFVNVGVIVSCQDESFLDAHIEVDERRLLALHPALDLAAVRAHLATIPAICAGGETAGPIGKLSRRERFDWLTAPRSTMIQTSPVHAGRCTDPRAALEHLVATMVRAPAARG